MQDLYNPKDRKNEQQIFSSHVVTISGDISFSPGPVYIKHLLNLNEWNVFESKGIHLICLNVSSLLPKINEIRYIAKRTSATVIGKNESKLNESIFQSEK